MEAPRIPSFFKVQKAKIFDYKPRYYDRKKETLDQLKRTGKRTKGQFFNRNNLRSVDGKRLKRIFIIIITLFLLSYLLLL
tara:strand:+ start:202 stop:441 length:240 start_codon:yes stop_codon:yes gene_type:complete